MRHYLSLLLAGLVALAGAGGAAAASPAPILIGAVLSFSGPSAPLGVPQVNSLQLAEREINAKGGIGGHPVHFQIVDDEAKPDVAAQLAQQLIGQGAVAIICGTRTATSAAVVRVTTGANVVQIFLTPTTELWKTPKGVTKTVFQAAATAENEAKAEVMFAQDTLKAKSIAILHDDNEYGVGATKATTDAATALNLPVVATEAYSGTSTDFTPQLLRIKAAKPDVLMIIGATQTPALATVQTRALLGSALPVMGTSAVLNPAFLAVVGANEGPLFADTNFNFTYPDAVAKAYIASYTQTYHAPAVLFGAFAYDSAYLLKTAIEKSHGKTDGTTLANTLETMGAYHGTSGTYRYSATDHNGLSPSDVHIAQARKGVWFTLK